MEQKPLATKRLVVATLFRSFDQAFGIFLHIYCKMFFKPRDAGDNVP